MPTLAVVVCAYNVQGYLDASLAALAGQSRPADQIVVVDDASTDATLEVIERWRAPLNLEVVRQPRNAGSGYARRSGLEQVRTDLATFLDADDYCLPDHLAVLLDGYRDESDLVTARYLRWVAGQALSTTPRPTDIPPPEQQMHAILRRNFLTIFTLFPIGRYREVGGYRSLRRAEDWDLWVRLLRAGSRVRLTPTPTVFYRMRADSISEDNACLADDIRVLENALAAGVDTERPALQSALRRRRAKLTLIDSFAAARAGKVGRARARSLRALVTDRSLRGGLTGPDGSVALQAFACLTAPRYAVRRRDARRRNPADLVSQ